MKREDIQRLAHLSRIAITDEEADALAGEFTSILEYVSEINDIAGSDAPEKKVGALANVMREDSEPHAGGKYTEAVLAAAPKRHGQYIEVRKILDEKK